MIARAGSSSTAVGISSPSLRPHRGTVSGRVTRNRVTAATRSCRDVSVELQRAHHRLLEILAAEGPGTNPGFRPALELVHVTGRHPEHPRDDAGRDHQREPGDEVAGPFVDEVVDQMVGQLLDERLAANDVSSM